MVAASARAELPAGSPTLDAIQRRGKLVVGSCFKFRTMLVDNPATGDPQGFDADIARLLAARMLGDEHRIEWRWAQGKDNYGNIRFLVRGDVDIIVDPIGESADKEAVGVAFTDDVMPAGNALLVPKGSPIRSVADLKTGTRVIVSDFFADVALLKEICRGHAPKFLVYGDEWDAREALRSGAGDVYADHITHLYDEAAANPNVTIVGQWTYAVYGFTVKSGDPVFLKYLNGFIADLKASGQWQRLYDRWFTPYLTTTIRP
jgi:putative glutamine transport system substrate-binding protein